MEFYPISLIKYQKAQQRTHNLLDKLYILGIQTLKDFYDYDIQLLNKQLNEIHASLIQELESFQENAKKIQNKFKQLEVQDIEFGDSSDEEDEEENDQEILENNQQNFTIQQGIPFYQYEKNLNYQQFNNTNKYFKEINSIINFREITEICGAPGSGKTQFCYQIMQNCLINSHNSNKNYKILYLDFDGTFNSARFAEFCYNHFDFYKIKPEKALENINIVNFCLQQNEIELKQVFDKVVKYIIQENQGLVGTKPIYKLIIIDGLYKSVISKQKYEQTQAISQFLQKMQKLAQVQNLSIVMTSPLLQQSLQTTGLLKKSEYFSHIQSFVATKIILQKEKNQFQFIKDQQIKDLKILEMGDLFRLRKRKDVLIIQKCQKPLEKLIEVPLFYVITEFNGIQIFFP